jgi:hypothetical protein
MGWKQGSHGLQEHRDTVPEAFVFEWLIGGPECPGYGQGPAPIPDGSRQHHEALILGGRIEHEQELGMHAEGGVVVGIVFKAA